MSIHDFVDHLIAYGRCCFTLDEAASTLQQSRNSLISAIKRLKVKGVLASPAKGFYTIVTPEYRVYGCLPPQLFIPYLMDYWETPYYVGLLSAAMYLGASHQQPQVFQVITTKSRPMIHCGKVQVKFYSKNELTNTPTQLISTEKSQLIISTPEATAMDLLLYPSQSGGLNHIVTILDELQETMNANSLEQLLTSQPGIQWKQRLGYLLEQVNAESLAEIIYKNLYESDRIDYIPLATNMQNATIKNKNKKWKIIENVKLEGDL